ncbi:sigma-70 family RNA polymerase sigma factor [Embleya sp. AB8]|uniref:sigma-70 family RNA polymerase sigma factor n=1 Tax=Embleya sp. AB8 TaxID=3156304 RepID=UPI003C77C8DF
MDGQYRQDGRNRQDGLAELFETHRDRLRAVAYRMLGSSGDAEDAVQEAWLRLARVDAEDVDNLGGWLTTVVSRVCLDMLRSRRSRREDLTDRVPDDSPSSAAGSDPEHEALLADEVGRAMLVVLDRLAPAERVAFVLHDGFAMPFERIAPIVGRSPMTAKKLASRARGKVRGAPAVDHAELAAQRRVVEAFLAAARAGDVDALLAVLAPDVLRRGDRVALPAGRASEVRGAHAVAEEIAAFGRNARFAEPALVDGAVGVVVVPGSRLSLVIAVLVDGDRIAAYELIADPVRLRQLELRVLAADQPAAPAPSDG